MLSDSHGRKQTNKRTEKCTMIFGTFIPECFSKVRILILSCVDERELEDEAIFSETICEERSCAKEKVDN